MNIRDDAYRLYTLVMKSPSREQVGDLIRRLNGTEFGYIARNHHAQILGYLMVDQERDKLEEAPFNLNIQLLNDFERKLMSAVHMQIVQLNEQCTVPVRDRLHNCAMAIDPFNKFQYNAPLDTPACNILSQDAIDAMAKSFHRHPAIIAALDSCALITNKVTESHYVASVLKFTEILIREGVFNTPKELTDIAFTQSKESQYRLVARHLIALMCIRDSLAILDQLIYKAMVSDRLPVLTEDNIIDIEGPSHHHAGSGLSLIYQPDQLASFVEVFDLVIVKCSSLQAPIDLLYRVERVRMEYSRDSGQTLEVALREIDENLNPYGSLLDHI